MPKRPQPRYDSARNQWCLNYKYHKHYLCSGKENEYLAWQKADRIMGRTADVQKPRTITHACEQWLRFNGSNWHKSILSPFIIWTAQSSIKLDDIHADTLRDYLRWLRRAKYTRGKSVRGYSPSTIRRQVRYARAVLRWCNVRGFSSRPVPEIPRLPRIPSVARDLAAADLAAVFDKLPARARQLLSFILCTGCRPNEACALKYTEILEDRCELQRGKTWLRTGRPRIIYLTAEARAVIDRQRTRSGFVFRNRYDKPYSPAGLRSILKRAGQRAGVELTGTYQLRHSWAQFAVDNGLISLDAVGEALGHQPGSPETKVYARISRQRTTKEVQSLSVPIRLDSSPVPPRRSPRRRKASPKIARRRTLKNDTAPSIQRAG